MDDALQLLAQRCQRHAVVHVEEHRAQQLRAAAGPVLERLLNEILQRNDQAPIIPDTQHHVSAGDLLHAAPLALDDQHIVQPDRLGQRQLQAGNQVAEHRLGGKAGDQADHARRGQQAGADLPRTGEGHQHHRRANHDHQRHGDARQHPRLRMDAPRAHVVRHIDGVPFQHTLRKAGDDARRQPRRGDNHQQTVEMPHVVDPAQVIRRRLPYGLQRQQRQHRLGRRARLDHDGMQHRRCAGNAQQQQAAQAMRDQCDDDGDQRGGPSAEPGMSEEEVKVHASSCSLRIARLWS
ncbi:hypothetical protein D9M70_467470 [compost metagenome]